MNRQVSFCWTGQYLEGYSYEESGSSAHPRVTCSSSCEPLDVVVFHGLSLATSEGALLLRARFLAASFILHFALCSERLRHPLDGRKDQALLASVVHSDARLRANQGVDAFDHRLHVPAHPLRVRLARTPRLGSLVCGGVARYLPREHVTFAPHERKQNIADRVRQKTAIGQFIDFVGGEEFPEKRLNELSVLVRDGPCKRPLQSVRTQGRAHASQLPRLFRHRVHRVQGRVHNSRAKEVERGEKCGGAGVGGGYQ
jgi:hypothetical protein